MAEISSTVLVATAFIPSDKKKREYFKNTLALKGIMLPKDDSYGRKNMREQDLMVLLEPFRIEFDYDYKHYSFFFRKGFVWDSGSVPTSLVHGNLNKFGQAIEVPSMVHDYLFATKAVSFEDANNIFKMLLESTGLLSKITIGLYHWGVSTKFGRKLYEESDPETYWGKGYAHVTITRKPKRGTVWVG